MSNSTLIAFGTIMHKEIRRILRIWPQSLIPPVITSMLYFVVFGAVIGSRIGQIAGFPYAQYIAPGLIVSAAISNAYSNSAASFFLSKFDHSIEGLLIAPIPFHTIALGYISGSIVRGTMVGVLIFAVSIIFTDIQLANPIFTLITLLLSTMLFAIMGLINGMLANNFDDTAWVASFILTPLNYLGGIFYSIEVLPEIWQNISHANPMLYVISAFRFGTLGHASTIDPYRALIYLAAFTIATYWTAIHIMRNGIGLKQ